MQIFGLLILSVISGLVTLVTMGISLMLERLGAVSFWRHLLRGAASFAGCSFGLVCAIIASALIAGSDMPTRYATPSYWCAFIGLPLFWTLVCSFKAVSAVRLAHSFTSWLVRETGTIDPIR